MSKFGWSYPPGVSDAMICPPEQPCELCGKMADNCDCPECPVCGSYGCIQHEAEDALRIRLARLEYLANCAKRELIRRGQPVYLQEPDIALHDDPDSDL